MDHRKTLTRLITCQGTIQLIAALAALNTRESEQKNSGYEYEYENILLIYDLYGPPGQLEAFADFVKKMALAVCDWKAIIYLRAEEMVQLAADLDPSTHHNVIARIHELVGVAKCDEIYVCRDWQFGNRLMLNAYQSAEKICYGDAIGVYFSEAYFSPSVATKSSSLKSEIRSKLRHLRNSLRPSTNLLSSGHFIEKAYALLDVVNFDVGYFLLPDILGHVPPMETHLVRKEVTEKIFRRLAEALDNPQVNQRFEIIARGPTVILMTSNFSENQRMSGEGELVAYRKFLRKLDYPSESTLIIKPHPRDSEKKIQQLGHSLRDLFSEVILMNDPNLFFVPFEIFLMQIFRGANEKALHNLKIVTFSTACLPLPVLFNLVPEIGYGSELVKEFFSETYVDGRIQHESDLRIALQRLAQVG